jgi:hypothetical protein
VLDVVLELMIGPELAVMPELTALEVTSLELMSLERT